MRNVRIAQKEESRKGRSFKAVCLATIEADTLWDGGATAGDKIRPVWAVFAGSDGDLRPFVANLRAGKRILFGEEQNYRGRNKGEQMEFLRSAPYEHITQRTPEGVIVTVFLPDLFRPDPGMVDPESVKFVLLSQRAWLEAQTLPGVAAVVRHARQAFKLPKVTEYRSENPSPAEVFNGFVEARGAHEIIALATLFAAYLDRRTRCPLVADPRFYVQLMLACLREGLACFPPTRNYYSDSRPFGEAKNGQFEATDVDALGLASPIMFSAKHAAVEALLADEVDLYFKLTGKNTSPTTAKRLNATVGR